MNLDTIEMALENATMTKQAREVLETVLRTLELCEVDEHDIEDAVEDEVEEVYGCDIKESLQYLLDISCNYFGDLINMGMDLATEFTCYRLTEEIMQVLRRQEVEGDY